MIDSIHFYSQHTLLGLVADGIPAIKSTLDALVNKVALAVITQVVITVPLFYLHHNLFALGFVVGFIFDKQVREIVQKVNVVYNAQQTLLDKVLFYGGGVFLAILTMPTSMIAATLYYSSQWGALLYQNCKNSYPKPADADKNEVKGEVEIPA